MIITEKLRTKILLSLPKGYAKTIAANCGVSEQTVYNVLHHESRNMNVAEALIILARKHKEKISKDQKRINQLAKQL